MPEITVFEGDDSKYDVTLQYHPSWSDSAKAGNPVAQADVTRTYFYVKTNLSDSTAWLKLDDKPLGTFTVTIATPAVFTLTSHGFAAGDMVYFTTTGSLPTGLLPNTIYFVLSSGLAANTFEVAATSGGTAINTTGSQSGVHTAKSGISWINGPLATDGKIRVATGIGTIGNTGDAQYYELRVKFTDGTYITAEQGTFNVKNSVIDAP